MIISFIFTTLINVIYSEVILWGEMRCKLFQAVQGLGGAFLWWLLKYWLPRFEIKKKTAMIQFGKIGDSFATFEIEIYCLDMYKFKKQGKKITIFFAFNMWKRFATENIFLTIL